MKELRVGDIVLSPRGEIIIIDEDRLCYLVRNTDYGKHSEGVRTISKALLLEFVQYFKQYPLASSNEARMALTGMSKIDKFEYGYASTLTTLAKWILE